MKKILVLLLLGAAITLGYGIHSFMDFEAVPHEAVQEFTIEVPECKLPECQSSAQIEQSINVWLGPDGYDRPEHEIALAVLSEMVSEAPGKTCSL